MAKRVIKSQSGFGWPNLNLKKLIEDIAKFDKNFQKLGLMN